MSDRYPTDSPADRPHPKDAPWTWPSATRRSSTAPGRPAGRATWASRDGRIVAIGDARLAARSARRTTEVDGTGLMLTPGFVDPHTHYDAQLFWDPTGSPSNLHGVTTVIAGNCGFTLAPLTPGDGDYTRRMMAKVEGMPLKALEEGIEWDWSTFPEYLDRLDGQPRRQRRVPRRALRAAPPGDGDRLGRARGHRRRRSSAMRELLAEGIRAGGLGLLHDAGPHPLRRRRQAGRVALGRRGRAARPGRRSSSEHPGTTLEFASDGCLDGFDDDEVEFMIRLLQGRQPPAELERAHHRLARPGALPQPARGDGPLRRRGAPRSWRSPCR